MSTYTFVLDVKLREAYSPPQSSTNVINYLVYISNWAAKAGQKSLVLARQTQTNQPGKDPFHLYSLSPPHLSFNSQQGGYPSLVSLVSLLQVSWVKQLHWFVFFFWSTMASSQLSQHYSSKYRNPGIVLKLNSMLRLNNICHSAFYIFNPFLLVL